MGVEFGGGVYEVLGAPVCLFGGVETDDDDDDVHHRTILNSVSAGKKMG